MTDLRALCARMADELDHYRQLLTDDRREVHPLAVEARDALAQPEPQGATDEELGETYRVAYYACKNRQGPAAQVFGLRAVLAKWGRPAIEPVPVTKGLPGPEDCDAKGRSWFGGKRGIWMLMTSKYAMADSFWLPHHALPVPQQEAE